jgi:nitroreductase
MSSAISLNPLLAARWSPRTFQPEPVSAEILHSLFEAARWAASCFNEQPWRFVVATQDQPGQFERVLATLAPKNREWAKDAWVLGISAAKKTFTHSAPRTGSECTIPEPPSPTS